MFYALRGQNSYRNDFCLKVYRNVRTRSFGWKACSICILNVLTKKSQMTSYVYKRWHLMLNNYNLISRSLGIVLVINWNHIILVMLTIQLNRGLSDFHQIAKGFHNNSKFTYWYRNGFGVWGCSHNLLGSHILMIKRLLFR